MADNNIRRSGLRVPKNNIKLTFQEGADLPTKGNKNFLKKVIKEANQHLNKLKIASRRNYMGRTLKAGADEFNNTEVRAKKGGAKIKTGDIARNNREIKISKAGRPTLRGGTLANLLMIGAGALADRGVFGDKVKQSRYEFNNRIDQVMEPGFFNLP